MVTILKTIWKSYFLIIILKNFDQERSFKYNDDVGHTYREIPDNLCQCFGE